MNHNIDRFAEHKLLSCRASNHDTIRKTINHQISHSFSLDNPYLRYLTVEWTERSHRALRASLGCTCTIHSHHLTLLLMFHLNIRNSPQWLHIQRGARTFQQFVSLMAYDSVQLRCTRHTDTRLACL
jgi:hypothetical protein